jgi:RimJ/RimL family protein N-acetyltransferase
MERGDAWAWSLRLRSDPGRRIGSIALWRREEENRGFWMGLRWQGWGLMAEACDAVTDFWFDVLGLPVLRVSKAAANEASRRISLRQGMRRVRVEERDSVSGRQPSEVWETTAAEWRARRGGGPPTSGG